MGFVTQGASSPYQTTVSSLAGVIVTSPLITQTKPAPKLLRWVGGKASSFAPHKLIPATVVAGVRPFPCNLRLSIAQSRDIRTFLGMQLQMRHISRILSSSIRALFVAYMTC